MSKIMKCSDVRLDCDFVARGENEQVVLSKAAEHAREDHGMESIPDDLLVKVKAAVHDE